MRTICITLAFRKAKPHRSSPEHLTDFGNRVLKRIDQGSQWDDPWRVEADVRAWFHNFYFDPAAEQEAGINRAYRWLPQDIINPHDVISDHFGRQLSQIDLSRIAEDLNRESSNWRSRPDEFETFAGGHEAPIANSISKSIETLRENLLEEIRILKLSVDAVRRPSARYDHNMPPEGVDDNPALNAELDDLSAALQNIEAQARSEFPDATTIQNAQRKLTAFAGKFMSWSGERTTKFVDATLDASGKAIGAALLLKISGLLPQIFSVVTTAGQFISEIYK